MHSFTRATLATAALMSYAVAMTCLLRVSPAINYGLLALPSFVVLGWAAAKARHNAVRATEAALFLHIGLAIPTAVACTTALNTFNATAQHANTLAFAWPVALILLTLALHQFHAHRDTAYADLLD